MSFELSIEYWKEAGLDRPTTIRIGKLLQLMEADIVKYRGKLDPRDILCLDLRIAGVKTTSNRLPLMIRVRRYPPPVFTKNFVE